MTFPVSLCSCSGPSHSQRANSAVSKADTLFQRLALALPDIPKWVETRSMLLSGACEILGFREGNGVDLVARDPATHLISVVGWPGREAILEAVSRNGGDRGVVIAQFDYQGPAVAALPRWRKGYATVHMLGDTPEFPAVPAGTVRLLTSGEVAALSELSDELRSAFEIVVRRGQPLAATIVEGAPVSFCYAGSVTESLWDISIDTLDAYRRRGFAAMCAAYMLRHMRKQGKEPVWGAMETNQASLRLAAKLGFVPVDRVVVFEPPNAVG